ncbi:MAG: hypothetical protein FJZ12_00590 [Candidatus Omnitrophica bacterium]|nr:hypothetical protein [Candidatus Omnitrophota bacterium]
MAKKESVKKDPEQKTNQQGNARRPSWISEKALDIIKLILGICFLPFVYSSTVSFLGQIKSIGSLLQGYFWSGVIAFILIYLFVFELQWVYERGHKILEFIFSFFQPLLKVGPYLLPIYTIVVLLAYLILVVFIKESWLINYTVFFLGLSIALHLIFTSKAIRLKKGDLLRSNYIFSFSFIYIIDLGLLALILNIIIPHFSFVDFCSNTGSIAGGVFKAVFLQLFRV